MSAVDDGRPTRYLANLYGALGFLALIVLVQATLTARIRLLGASPNLLLVVVVSRSLIDGVTTGMLWGFAGGLILDLVAGMPLGTTSLALMAASFLAGPGTQTVFVGNVLLPVFVVALATPVHGWSVLLTQQFRGLPVDWIASTVRVIGPETMANMALIVVVYPLMRWLSARPPV